MKQIKFNIYDLKFVSILLVLLVFTQIRLKAQCDSSTPSFTLDLSGSSNASSVTPTASRNGTCCNGIVPCVKIVVLLHPNAMALMLTPTGADPGGALTYEFNCNGIQIPGGTPVCLSGTGPQTLTICKVGNNANAYSVVSIPKPAVPDSIFVRSGCSQTLAATGFSVPSITWAAVNGGSNTALFNSYLSCTVGCASVTVTPSGTVPVAFVDYRVSGLGAAPCETNFYADTVRVFFYNDLAAPLSPTTICFGSISAVLNPTPTGGKPAYTYTWSTSSNSSSITVGPGNYTVIVSDQTGCPPITSTVTVSQFTAAITANPGPSLTLCKGPPSAIPLNGTVSIASGGTWSGGSGSFSPSNTVLTTSYLPTTTEITAGSVQLILTSTGNQGCPPGTGTLNISFQNQPLLNAGTDKTVCANNNLVTLSGTVSAYPSTVIWSTAGTGTFSSITNSNTTYTPSNSDISAGSVSITVTSTNNGVCPPANDLVIVYITPKPIVNAGTDQLICSTNTVALSGTVTAATTSGVWSTSGSGTFVPSSNVLSTGYIPGTADINNGTVTIVLTSTNNGNCLAEKDTVKIFIRKIAVVNAGLNQVVCSNSNSILLNGSVTGGTTTGAWTSSGIGAFIPGNTNLITSYSFTSNDVTNASVIFTLTSTNNGPCPAVNDSVLINIRELATVNAGANQFLCSLQGSISLAGSVTGSTGTGSWTSSGTGSFVPTNTGLNTTYSLTTNDINNGFVILSLTSSNNGVCPAVTDTVRMKIAKLAIVTVGPDQFLCSNTPTIALTGTVLSATGIGNWNSSGAGAFTPSASSLTTTYSITPTDVLAGNLKFILSSGNNGPCPVVTDSVKVSFFNIAVVNSGPNQLICSSQNIIQLSGSIMGSAGTGSWAASGNGAFSPAASSLITSYSITPNDISSGSVTFTLTSTSNSVCPAVKDTVKIMITKLALVEAGLNQSVCSIQNSIALSGTVSSASATGFWTSSSMGSFSPASSNLTTNYILSPTDAANGTVLLTLESTNNGPCPTMKDTLRTNISIPAQVSAGTTQTICSTMPVINLNGIVFAGSTTGIWATDGTGTFTPNNNALTLAYFIAQNDLLKGLVNFTLTSTNNGFCPANSSSVQLIIKRTATVNAGPDNTICTTTPLVNLNGTILGSTTNGNWTTNGSGIFIPGPNTAISAYSISASDINIGSLIFILLSTNNDVCSAGADTLKLNIIKNPQVSLLSDLTICENESPVSISGQVIGGSGSVRWLSSGTGTFNPTDKLITNYKVSKTDVEKGSVIITLSSINNGPCVNVDSHMNLSILPSAHAQFTAVPNPVYISKEVVFTNQSTAASTYSWYLGDGAATTESNTSHIYESVGYYTVTLVANNEVNCSDIAKTVITAISDIKFPNAFTPNTKNSNGGTYSITDLTNDVFFPYTSGVVEYELMIFNRWGELIYRSNDIAIGWDGYFNGKLCQQDTYVWKVNLKFFDGRTFNEAGSVTLLR